ncbi:type II toxin-antitoxin system VapC family toxin [Cellulosimicrobium terreum]|nr:type II toxin-antitoxin system VapC family toxin [Cellulosimicrobium terreum]
MTVLLDTHLLLWALYEPELLPGDIQDELSDPGLDVWFSAVNIWEIAIKASLDRPDFAVDPTEVRSAALGLGFVELAVDGIAAAAVRSLPRLHGDPFDRLLLAQALTTGNTLLTHDVTLGRHPGPVRVV